jgi:hypothetical protein
MLRSSERGAVRRRSSFSMIGGSRGLRQTRAAAGVRAPAAARRVAARNRGAGAASGRTTPLCPDPGRTRRPRPAISHIPLSPISRRDVGLGLLSPAAMGCPPLTEADPGRGTGRGPATSLSCPGARRRTFPCADPGREPMLGRSSALVPDPGSDPSPGRAFARGVAGNTVALA